MCGYRCLAPLIDKNGYLVGIVSGATGKMGVVGSVEYLMQVVESLSLNSTAGPPR
ncbi:MAG: hypothetical protein HKO65_13790 [Gemmatimonadetes bacterium]|nr:hypothetical protein [Gemmatimonadota bacterium]NNM06156.1 hypothetical protein [Gemmatimonadota bacterium]